MLDGSELQYIGPAGGGGSGTSYASLDDGSRMQSISMPRTRWQIQAGMHMTFGKVRARSLDASVMHRDWSESTLLGTQLSPVYSFYELHQMRGVFGW
jgi:hypothetical protein